MAFNAETQSTQKRRGGTIVFSLCGLCVLGAFAFQREDARAAEPATTERHVAATVKGEPVLKAEVDLEFRRAYGERQFADADRQQLMRAARDQVIDRRLVLDYLTSSGQAASKGDVDAALSQFEKELKAQNLTLAQHCEKVGLTPDDIRRSLAWKLSWKRYCDRYLTAENLEKYFERNRREFDGTQLRVAQILFKLPAEADEAAMDAAKERATKVRQEIVSGKIAFSETAKKHSEAPSSEAGGDIGWIERHKPMPEGFSRAAYALKKGDVSEPIVSPFGVHLVTVLDEKPGTRTWRDAESELRPAVTLYLFRWIADRQRAAVKIEYIESGK
jgi:peptidyl-prolyl cis-trans isomerase C